MSWRDHRADGSSSPRTRYTSSGSRASSRIRSVRTSSLAAASTSSRTGVAPRSRRRSTDSIASSRSPPSSSSSSKSASLVSRKTECPTISIPGKRTSRWAAMTCSMGTNRSPSGSSTNRGSNGGTFTRAKRRSPLAGSRTSAARFSESEEMYGNGCAGSTDSGVSTGNTRSRKSDSRCPRSLSSSSAQSTIRSRSFSSSGRSSSDQSASARELSSTTRSGCRPAARRA